jgi:polyhydroxybutyrate depolymerase
LELSDENGFLVLVPNGVDPGTGDPRGDSQHWNDLRDDWKGGSDADDVGFLTALVDWAVSDRDVDPSRVYVTGPSNGGMMTYRLLVERPSVFAAGVALIANLPQADVAPPTSSTPLMIMNGTKDKLIPWDGGEVGRNRGVVRSSLATRDYWIGANDADAGAVRRETVSQRTLFNRCRIESEFYPASPAAGAAAPVRFCTMDGGGHVIPTERWTYVSFLYRFIGGPPCWGVSGADISWEFMSTYG